MPVCKFYQGCYKKFCKKGNSGDPACATTGGDYYGPGKPAGCYNQAERLLERFSRLPETHKKLARRHRKSIEFLFHK